MNEPADNRDLFVLGTPATLSQAGAKWVLRYIQAVLDGIPIVNCHISSRSGAASRAKGTGPATSLNLAFDVEKYYFEGPTLPPRTSLLVCSDAQASPGDDRSKYSWVGGPPGFALRERDLNVGLAAFHKCAHGASIGLGSFFRQRHSQGPGIWVDF